jgi:hypothetical protein
VPPAEAPAARRKSMDRDNGGSATPSGPRKSMSVWDDNGYVLSSAPSGSMGMGGMMGGGMMGG